MAEKAFIFPFNGTEYVVQGANEADLVGQEVFNLPRGKVVTVTWRDTPPYFQSATELKGSKAKGVRADYYTP